MRHGQDMQFCAVADIYHAPLNPRNARCVARASPYRIAAKLLVGTTSLTPAFLAALRTRFVPCTAGKISSSSLAGGALGKGDAICWTYVASFMASVQPVSISDCRGHAVVLLKQCGNDPFCDEAGAAGYEDEGRDWSWGSGMTGDEICLGMGNLAGKNPGGDEARLGYRRTKYLGGELCDEPVTGGEGFARDG
ncbi:predicted protein [Aspergillus nidulans FGSC A4]|uniref:Uncharacterized protein n=1 Tax=Emericella nidulans (strain FGSC A4 / ATCC 38163 / CBS 112.46 / NRRL 194 / M139) TaxID=227321 RepID=Q5AZ55_EMENI|nr:hypothetical protein [Aspergillus nidulans FGSC A4]EAA58447.1 predicted protein [Aspergillus nidulans FGSC A4]CBF69497.1 TPA: hypothetical protein ANIA_06425 [Aspergillus nidulans FGSC A4]|eukprot:XP_664029.1 predicted protein [Aspergillus nidulans FGSC A4]